MRLTAYDRNSGFKRLKHAPAPNRSSYRQEPAVRGACYEAIYANRRIQCERRTGCAYIRTEWFEAEEVKRPLFPLVDLQQPEGAAVSPDVVMLYAHVEEYTEKSPEIPVTCPDSTEKSR